MSPLLYDITNVNDLFVLLVNCIAQTKMHGYFTLMTYTHCNRTTLNERMLKSLCVNYVDRCSSCEKRLPVRICENLTLKVSCDDQGPEKELVMPDPASSMTMKLSQSLAIAVRYRRAALLNKIKSQVYRNLFKLA